MLDLAVKDECKEKNVEGLSLKKWYASKEGK
mgnify:CR=1 FL=1